MNEETIYEPAGGFVADLETVTVAAFAAVEEAGAEPLLGLPGEAVIPENGDVMFYGDGGAGKTTLAIDMGFHLAAGDPWLGIAVPRTLRVLLIENEGPRPLFRAKLRRKLERWDGSPVDDRLLVVQAPWARFTFADERCRQALAGAIHDLEIDVVICGPVTRSGMDEAGTLQEVRDFMLMVDASRQLAERHVTFVLVHHENKGGKVSGAWEGAGDTLLHVQAQGHGRTRVYVQKARWASAHHATTLNLTWTDGEGFAVDAEPGLDDETLAAQIATYIAENPGTGWSKVEKATPGVERERRRNVRAGMFAARRIVNLSKEDGEEVLLDHCPERKTSRLYLADDPTIAHLRRGSGADAAQIAPAWGENRPSDLRRAPRPIGGAVGAGADSPPSSTPDGGADEGELAWR